MQYPQEMQELIARFNNDWKHIDTPADWFPFVLECHKELVIIDPNYQIEQIKEKFGGLRYYFAPSSPDKNKELLQVTFKWERKVAEYEQSKRQD